MTTTIHTPRTVVGVFENSLDAERAVEELYRMGFRDEQIGVTGPDWRNRVNDDEFSNSYAAEGAAAGAVSGAGIGALWGLGIAAGVMPIIGPAIAAGTLAALLSSAAAGAAAASLGGMLIGMGIPREEAKFYESELELGRILVTVNVGTREQEVRQVFRQNNAYDYSTRMETTHIV